MRIIDTLFSQSATPELALYVIDALDSFNSLEEFVDFWLREEGWSLTFMPVNESGKEPKGAGPDVLLVRLKFFGVEVALLKLDSKALRDSYPDARVVTSFVRGVQQDARFELDDDGLEEWLREHRFAVCDALCEHLGPRESLVPFVLLYALSDSSLVHIGSGRESFISSAYDEYRCCCSAEGLELDDLVCVTVYYRTPHAAMEKVPTLVRSAFFTALHP